MVDVPDGAYYGRRVPEEEPDDLRGFHAEADDGALGRISETTHEHLVIRIHRGPGRHDEILVPRILVAEVDREGGRVRLSASRGEIERLHGGDRAGRGLGAWFGGITTTPQQPFPPTLPGPDGAPEEDRPT
jgi:hypothetical protein